ncbi:MAG TPA: bifunctional nuclease family protein [Acidimicrobiales bacterium]|nr:bifunctional nuclease family protein [Acidimicrobiales bacterium]
MAELARVAVAEVRTAVPSGLGVEAGMMVLREEGEPHRTLRIIMAQPEARAIYAAWHATLPVRPSTWDLFVSAIALLEGRIDRAVITAVEQERHFFAAIELEHAGQRRTISCRPSDAVALALRAHGAEIFADEEVLAAAGRLADGTKPPAPQPPAPQPPQLPDSG